MRVLRPAKFCVPLLALLPSACAGDPGIYSKKTALVKITKANSKGSCRYNQILASPSANSIAIFHKRPEITSSLDWTSPEGLVLIRDYLPNRAVGNKKRPRIDVVSAGANRIAPIAWDGDTLNFRVGRDKIASTNFASQWEIKLDDLPRVWRNFQIHSLHSTNISQLYDRHIIFNAQAFSRNSNFLRRSIHLGNTSSFSAVDINNAQNLVVGDAYDDMKGIGTAAFFRNFSFERSSKGHAPYFLDSVLDENNNVHPHALPIIDRNTGVRKGNFTSTRLIGLNWADRLQKEILESGFSIISAVINQDRIFVLSKNRSLLRVYWSDKLNGETHSFDVCSKPSFPPMHPLAVTADERDNEVHPAPVAARLSSSGDTSGILFRSLGSSSNSLVVYFHGGPAGTAYDKQIPPELEALRSTGHDILMVEYSGSVGGGLPLSLGLARKPVFGFQEDSQAINEFITENTYNEVMVYATSFGTAPGLVFLRNNKSIISRSAFLAPLLLLPRAEVTETAGGKLMSTKKGSQIQFELGVFGSEERRLEFAYWLKHYAASLEADQSMLFVFGELDKKTPLSAAPINIRERARIEVIPKTIHNLLGSRDSTRDLISDHLLAQN